ncbi:MAG: 50S ribosomal protein L30 [Candidatus Phytoplasma stylosanthis]|uniref:50S ribosomal protein L30 n=1 Tax=Candidatus Phytoplasma stylosanthis TaxID=2798314 RepID=UPI00293AB4D4|nr:50S ribosomal protein L30 [Candidatus Phytoplasma stylosanthis]MDV3167856.1 50S ribosomal protein L30 [Candidatus Phytoplasma stylosanthis]MDV3170868.1 50S ribosomal protein L30 [Candidatus Phytoplasma stylosanthis]MDV3173506.1 50S ribosomal protein L30 [Candidatus Phytoplasma stylosanthis]MDV3174048.1 50S ribosomal protein L30 [Candidatus Phytoplasma stylosanthis]MDV3202440.1 50S ribosomal protein L30 [Candidatus Phytoplasma stylosanthis]
MKKLEIILKKSIIGRTPNQIKNIYCLGLRKINQKVIKQDSPVIRGIIKKINHLVLVKEIIEKESVD